MILLVEAQRELREPEMVMAVASSAPSEFFLFFFALFSFSFFFTRGYGICFYFIGNKFFILFFIIH